MLASGAMMTRIDPIVGRSGYYNVRAHGQSQRDGSPHTEFPAMTWIEKDGLAWRLDAQDASDSFTHALMLMGDDDRITQREAAALRTVISLTTSPLTLTACRMRLQRGLEANELASIGRKARRAGKRIRAARQAFLAKVDSDKKE
jgi:hypothetical protein